MTTRRMESIELRPRGAGHCIARECEDPVVDEMYNAVIAPVCAHHREVLKQYGWRVKKTQGALL